MPLDFKQYSDIISTFNPTVNEPTNGREIFEYVQKKLTKVKNINKTLFKRIS